MVRLARYLMFAALLGVTTEGAAFARPLPVSGSFIAATKAATRPAGVFSGTLDSVTDVLTYRITYTGLSGPVVAAHLHGAARRDTQAGVMKPIDGPYDSPIKGRVTLDKAQVKALEKGLVYVNLHTAANPGGEARAQLHVN